MKYNQANTLGRKMAQLVPRSAFFDAGDVRHYASWGNK